MANRTGLFVLGLALMAATTSAEVVEEERFDLVAPQSEMSASDEGDLNISSFEWVTVDVYENPPLLIAVFEDEVDIQPSALPSEAMIDDSLSVLPFMDEEDPRAAEQQHQAP